MIVNFKVKHGEFSMKKSFLATSKKVLLATSILAMSATAIAADDSTARMSESAKAASLTVTANYVKLLTVELDLSAIDFGDVFTGATVTDIPVTASITGDAAETFTYAITTSDGGVAVLASTAGLTGTDTVLKGDEAVTIPFTVGLDTSSITGDVSETVTIDITYDSIAGGTTTAA
ncbi:MAG: hypothetical protein ACI9RZ_001489 [Sphingobacteriales bacterium]|jgi:hypothetical protein